MEIILILFNNHKIGKNKYNPIKVIPITASVNLVIQILDGFIQLNQQAVV